MKIYCAWCDRFVGELTGTLRKGTTLEALCRECGLPDSEQKKVVSDEDVFEMLGIKK